MQLTADPGPKVYFLTLGCAKNDADSRALKRSLLAAGIPVADDPSSATHIVVNTCGFIQDAKEESIASILQICEENPGKRVLGIGCLVERYHDELAKGLPEVAGWFGVARAEMTSRLVQEIAGKAELKCARASERMDGVAAYAYLKISDGCDEGCTFCAIPGIKGSYESVPLEDILLEADSCLSEGARELVLVGQDTTRWQDKSLDVRGLIDVLASDERVRRIRIMYLQPARVDQAFIGFMAEHHKLCRYLDIPFQHSHSDVLRRMGRRGSADSYLQLLRQARETIPTVSVRSTFIVGFPGETERHFGHLVDFVRTGRFDYGGAFIYSPEEGTAAERLRPTVPRTVARRRLNSLNDVLWEVGEAGRQQLVGSEVEVMVDRVDPDEIIEGARAVGRTEGQAPEVDGVTYLVAGRDLELAPGSMVRVRVTEVLGCDLVGEICET